MLAQSLTSKLPNFMKSSRTVFVFTAISFNLIHASEFKRTQTEFAKLQQDPTISNTAKIIAATTVAEFKARTARRALNGKIAIPALSNSVKPFKLPGWPD